MDRATMTLWGNKRSRLREETWQTNMTTTERCLPGERGAQAAPLAGRLTMKIFPLCASGSEPYRLPKDFCVVAATDSAA
jgi:hypothetical protein